MLFRKQKMPLNTEIERKFLVVDEFKSLSVGFISIIQGYLSADPERTVRVRITDKQAFITVKGKSDETGMERYEWEQEIKIDDAQNLIKLCLPGIINKTRYVIEHGQYLIEVDEFHDENEGLILAEIELLSKNDKLILPAWIGKEVTNDKRYYNSYLTHHPFSTWAESGTD